MKAHNSLLTSALKNCVCPYAAPTAAAAASPQTDGARPEESIPSSQSVPRWDAQTCIHFVYETKHHRMCSNPIGLILINKAIPDQNSSALYLLHLYIWRTSGWLHRQKHTRKQLTEHHPETEPRLTVCQLHQLELRCSLAPSSLSVSPPPRSLQKRRKENTRLALSLLPRQLVCPGSPRVPVKSERWMRGGKWERGRRKVGGWRQEE